LRMVDSLGHRHLPGTGSTPALVTRILEKVFLQPCKLQLLFQLFEKLPIFRLPLYTFGFGPH
jgi:hypothetical protein